MEKISVIVPVYNEDKRLEVCLSSLLGQTFQNTEIILVNDGSTDRSSEVMHRYHRQHPQQIKAFDQPNGGVASARNKGLKEATGDFFMFVDADDSLHPDCLETVLAKAKEYGAQITRFGMTYQYTDGTEKTETNDFPGECFIEKQDFKKHVYPHMMTGIKMNSIARTLYQRQVIEPFLFREDMRTAEDLIFNIEVFTKATNFLYLPLPFYYYYQSNRGLTGNSISTLSKYKYNLVVSAVLVQHLKQWEMNRPSFFLKSVFRVLLVTFSKVKRRFFKRV